MVGSDGTASQLAAGQVLLGQRLRLLRQEQGQLIKHAAQAAGLSESYLTMIERGQRLPTLETLVTLANVYGVLPVEMLTGIYPFGERRRPGRVTPPTDARRRP